MPFFSPSKWQQVKQPLPLVAQCGACGLFEDCQTPKMPVSGKGRRRVLICAEAPGQDEDRVGIQLYGQSGLELQRLLQKIDVDMREDCWLTNAVICRPKNEYGRNRKPTHKEIGYCRPNLVKTLHQLQPDVIIPLGSVAVQSLMPMAWKDISGGKKKITKAMTSWAGWRIPCQKLNSWICPTFHPSYLLRTMNEGEDDDSVAFGPALEFHMTDHLREAFRLKGKPWGPKGELKPDYDKQVRVVFDHRVAEKKIREFTATAMPVAFDFETDMLKPDSKQASIICCSVSDGQISMAFPWYGMVVEAMKELFLSDVPKIGANHRFEHRWVQSKLGLEVKNWAWDTVVGAHWANCHRGVTSLKFQAFVRLGAEDYSSHLDEMMESEDSNSPNKLREVDMETLLHYCSLDSLLEVLVAKDQGYHA